MSIIGPNRTFESVTDYVHTLMRLVFNDFWKRRDSVDDEKDGRLKLYGLTQFCRLLPEWIKPEGNLGPFPLRHVDLSGSNIIVDEKLNIKGVLDWEWCQTVPEQLFTPPFWLTGLDLLSILSFGRCSIQYGKKLHCLIAAVQRRENVIQQSNSPNIPPRLSSMWISTKEPETLHVGHALLRLGYAGDVYWRGLDCFQNPTKDRELRVQNFIEATANHRLAKPLQTKVDALETSEHEIEGEVACYLAILLSMALTQLLTRLLKPKNLPCWVVFSLVLSLALAWKYKLAG
jgi:hypothetical protein